MHLIENIIVYIAKRIVKKSKNIKFEYYRPAGPLKILLIGYSGKRNIGAEARCVEIIKSIKNMSLPVEVTFSVLTLDSDNSRPFYDEDIEFIPLSTVFFKDLLNACSNHHIGILTEGSCFTSATSNIAATFFISAAGILQVQNKLCIAYGVEAGPMPAKLIRMLQKYCRNTHFIARTSLSLKIAAEHGLNALIGTDTAWSFTAKQSEWAIEEIAKKWRWDRGIPLVGISVINAFVRPIKPKIGKYLINKLTGKWNWHYDKFYFYTVNKKRLKLYNQYTQAIASGLIVLRKSISFIPVLIEMEPMDKACIDEIEKFISQPVIRFSAEKYTATEMAALLQQLSLLITSRYHAHVLSMPAGVPCVAISKDQRLEQLFKDNSLSEFCLSTHDLHLEDKLYPRIDNAWINRDYISNVLKNKHNEFLAVQAGMDKIVKHNSVLSMVEIFGSVLLIGLGLVKLCWLKNNAQCLKSTESGKKSKDFIAGVLTTLSNPKIALFYLFIIPQFIPHESGRYQLIAYMILCVIQLGIKSAALFVYSKLALYIYKLFNKYTVARYLNLLSGFTYIAIGGWFLITGIA